MHEVAITDSLAPPATIEEEVLKDLARVVCLQARSIAELRGRLSGFQGLIVFHEVALPAEIIDGLEACRVIVRCGVGVDNIDLRAANDRGIPVCNVPDYGVDEVADHAIGLMLACNRGIMLSERRLRRTLAPWDRRAVQPILRLAGATMGIIGCGRIGTATALRAKALKLRVMIYDPYLPPGIEKALGVIRTDLATLLSESDVVSLHTPLTEETRHLVDGQALRRMKPSAVLINTSRGAVVDVTALADALREKRLGGAGIDVLPVEPPRANEPLIRLWQEELDPPINLILTPHTAYYSETALVEMRTRAAEEVRRVLRGEAPKCCVNRPRQ